jgi:hypothetical protein
MGPDVSGLTVASLELMLVPKRSVRAVFVDVVDRADSSERVPCFAPGLYFSVVKTYVFVTGS